MSKDNSSTLSYASAVESGVDVQQAYEDALDDVHTRFLLNLPEQELATPDRIFFQLEQAWWFYDDMICDHSEIDLPRFKTLKPFAVKMFEISPILQPMTKDFDKLWQRFSLYKRTISTYGTILLNQDCTKVVLCQVWNSPSWTFPSGKVNQNEAGIDAGARETYEETGFDPNCQLGLAAQLQAAGKVTWKTPLQEEDGLVFTDGGKRRTCYVCLGVPEDFPFAPVARKEVSNVSWHDLNDIPKKSFAVLPYMGQLRRWIRKHTKTEGRKETSGKRRTTAKKSHSRNSSRDSSRGRVRDESDVVETGLASPGEYSGWSEEEMLAVNEKMLGKKIAYDGNPHHFAEKGFDGMDPHAFHLVGGGFMNSGISKLAPAPEQSKLQPLFRDNNRNEESTENHGLTPFFSSEGVTPWGDVVDEALSAKPVPAKKTKKKKGKSKSPPPTSTAKQQDVNAGQALLSMLQGGGQKPNDTTVAQASSETVDSIFLTDSQITARSQGKKTATTEPFEGGKETDTAEQWLAAWVRNLPQTPATERFGDFRFDVDKIMLAMDNI